MRFSKFVFGLLTIDQSIATILRSWISNEVLDEIDDPGAVAALDQLREWEKSDYELFLTRQCNIVLPADSEYKCALENMLAIAYFKSRMIIAGSQAEICFLAHIIANAASGHDDFPLQLNRVIHKFWRNSIAEHFVKFRSLTYKSPFYPADKIYKHDPEWMRLLVGRCAIVANEHFYYLTYDKIPFAGWNNMNTAETLEFCRIVRGLLHEYNANGRELSFDRGYSIMNPFLEQRLVRLAKIESTQTAFPKLVPLASQICFGESLPEDASSNRIAELYMNAEELAEYCSPPRQVSGFDMMELGLNSMERQLDGRFENLRLRTGHAMSGRVEANFYAFVDTAARIFDLNAVEQLWERMYPLTGFEDSLICGVDLNPSRLGQDNGKWDGIRELAKKFDEWDSNHRYMFCRIVRSASSSSKDEIDKRLVMFVLNQALQRICGRTIMFGLTDGTNPYQVAGLVAEVGYHEACRIFVNYNDENYAMTGADLVDQLFDVAVKLRMPKVHS